jgi:hypothetical protein
VVVTASKKAGPFYSCETEPLADYTNAVIGLASMQKGMGLPMNNIDPQTGEPQYEGETKAMVDAMRARAGVASFDEAATHCQDGPYRHHVTVINFQKDRGSTRVHDTTSNKSFWLPTSEIDRPAG